MERTRCSTCILHTAAPNGHPNSCPSSGSEATTHENHLYSDQDKFITKLSHEDMQPLFMQSWSHHTLAGIGMVYLVVVLLHDNVQ